MMELQKPSPHLLSVWRLRMLLVTVIPAFVSACFLPRINWMWWLFTAAWMGTFLGLYIWYYPIKYRKLAYAVNANCLLLHCGVIYTRVKAIPITAIVYLTVGATPLQRLLGVRTLFIYMAGKTAYLPGLTVAQADRLSQRLTPTDSIGGDRNV